MSAAVVVVAPQMPGEVIDVVYSGEPYSLRGERRTRNGEDGVLRGDLGVLTGDVVGGEGWWAETQTCGGSEAAGI